MPPPERTFTLRWGDWRLRLGAAFAIAASWGMLAGWWTPRGPVTSAQAVAAIAISVVVGVGTGLVLRSRWSMLVAPVVFAGVFELVRIGTSGPMVDGLHASTYGVIAFVVGRGFHGIVTLLPMLLGGAIGAGCARRLAGPTSADSVRHPLGSWFRRGVVGVTGVALVALSGLIITPARTDPILGSDGTVLRGSVAEITRVKIGGHQLSMMIRGASAKKPVLLFLAGGPGGSELGGMRRHLAALEKDFVVVTWDQRGTGRSYDALDPTSTDTLAGVVDDTIQVTGYLRHRFAQDKIYLLGQSWGTILGVLAVQKRPDLYRAYIGTGQMVSARETDRLIYRDTLAWAHRTGNQGLVDTLTDSGPPPYANMLDYEPALTHEQEVYPYDHSKNSEGIGQFGENIFVQEYSLIDKVHIFAGFLDVFTVLYPQLQNIDFRKDAARLTVPVYLVQGRHEADGRAVHADAWFAQLDAPSKHRFVLETSGHRPLFEQPVEFVEVMNDHVLAETAR